MDDFEGFGKVMWASGGILDDLGFCCLTFEFACILSFMYLVVCLFVYLHIYLFIYLLVYFGPLMAPTTPDKIIHNLFQICSDIFRTCLVHFWEF